MTIDSNPSPSKRKGKKKTKTNKSFNYIVGTPYKPQAKPAL